MIAGIIIAERNAAFIRMVYDSYQSNYKANEWDYNCAVVAYNLSLKHPDLVHIEPRSLTTPDWLDRKDLFDNVIDWSNLYVIHGMLHTTEPWTPDNVKTKQGTLGEVLRWLYFGRKEMIFTNATQSSTGATPSQGIVSSTSIKNK